jgi:hypothetical protein
MDKYHTTLTDEEKAILAKIDLRETHPTHDEGHAAFNANQQPILALLRSLSERQAVPEQRLKYWDDPVYNSGRTKASRKGMLKRPGSSDAEIYISPHFIQHLRYFLFGADLPDSLIRDFEERVGNPRWVTSSDILPIGKFARDLTRRHRLEPRDAAEEFFKLCLDMGLELSTAQSVMRSVQKIR